jgi:hypothetical protein
MKLTLLEDLGISTSNNCDYLFEIVWEACPHLEKLRVHNLWMTPQNIFSELIETDPFGISTTMCKLRAFELFNFEITARELEAILDTCPLLESLHVTGFCSFIMEKCVRSCWSNIPE